MSLSAALLKWRAVIFDGHLLFVPQDACHACGIG
jgi:hypothetical protein